jgi:hypothetical protein
VSTFKGPGSADDWVTINAETNCYFMPGWSSCLVVTLRAVVRYTVYFDESLRGSLPLTYYPINSLSSSPHFLYRNQTFDAIIRPFKPLPYFQGSCDVTKESLLLERGTCLRGMH